MTACSFCKEDFYRQPRENQTQADCRPCLKGGTCADNTSLAQVQVHHTHWRLHQHSKSIYPCHTSGNHSPCHGGSLAGLDGAGYCQAGHYGPLCELCEHDNGASDDEVTLFYFNRLAAQCTECPPATNLVLIGGGVVAGLATLAVLAPLTYQHLSNGAKDRVSRAGALLVARLRSIDVVPRVKQLFAFYQTVSAIPQVYNVRMPAVYTEWTSSITGVFDLDWSNIAVPGSCLTGGFVSRLFLRGIVPLVLMAVVLFVGWASSVGSHYHRAIRGAGRRAPKAQSRRASVIALGEAAAAKQPILNGLMTTLPWVLVLSFTLCASTSTSIFAAWMCDSYESDLPSCFGDECTTPTRSFLRDDPSLECYTDRHAEVTTLAAVFVLIWPAGMPILYLSVLVPCKHAIKHRQTTRLVQATGFLHREYKPELFWW